MVSRASYRLAMIGRSIIPHTRVTYRISQKAFSSEPPRKSNLSRLPKFPQNTQQLEHEERAKMIEKHERDAVLRSFNLNPDRPRVVDPESANFNPLKSLAKTRVAQKLGISQFIEEKNTQAEAFISRQAEASELPNDIRDMQAAMNIPTPSTTLTRHYNSPHVINLWDPKIRTKDMEAALMTSGVSLSSMDLIGHDLNNDEVNLREKIIKKNKVTLLIVASSQVPLQNGQVLQNIWLNENMNHTHTNSDGKLLVEPIVVNISDGWLSSLMQGSIQRSLRSSTPEELHKSTILFSSRNANDPIARARRFMEALNRFVAHVMLVDERGLVRWRSGLGAMPTPAFIKTLNKVTNDLLLETKYDEAD